MAMNSVESGLDYVIQVHECLDEIDSVEWDGLLNTRLSVVPFMRHAYLQTMHDTGCASSASGWQPLIFALRIEKKLHAACLIYLKNHSYGEYVFDWNWAEAYERHGLQYYPKLCGTSPFTPVTAPRLLGDDSATKAALLRAIEWFARQNQISSAHLLYLDESDEHAAREAGWAMRQTIQFHWINQAPTPYRDFDEFLSCLQRDKRKKIQQERRKVKEAGVTFQVLQGREIDTPTWDYFYLCYATTYREHHSTPYLSRRFFTEISERMPDNWLIFVAFRNGVRVGASLVGIDTDRKTAFGRYWGSTEAIPCLHFEACYYQPLEWCIQNGFLKFEGGAQGEHKMARGLVPVITWSAHWLVQPEFSQAIFDYVQKERDRVTEHFHELQTHQPFKSPDS